MFQILSIILFKETPILLDGSATSQPDMLKFMIEQRQVFGIVLLPPESICPTVRKVRSLHGLLSPPVR